MPHDLGNPGRIGVHNVSIARSQPTWIVTAEVASADQGIAASVTSMNSGSPLSAAGSRCCLRHSDTLGAGRSFAWQSSDSGLPLSSSRRHHSAFSSADQQHRVRVFADPDYFKRHAACYARSPRSGTGVDAASLTVNTAPRVEAIVRPPHLWRLSNDSAEVPAEKRSINGQWIAGNVGQANFTVIRQELPLGGSVPCA